MTNVSIPVAAGQTGWNTWRTWSCCLVAIVLLAGGLRIAGMFDDFWLDEIWSLEIAGALASPVEVFTKACVDNSHPLNTLLMYLIGQHPYWPIYRIPSALAGCGSVILAGLIMRRQGKLEGLLAALLVGVSYPMVAFSVEARGYAMMIFFALLGMYALQRFLDAPLGQPAPARNALVLCPVFWLAVGLGFLSNLMFMHFYLGALAWSAWRLLRQAFAGRDQGACPGSNTVCGDSGVSAVPDYAPHARRRHFWRLAAVRLLLLHGFPMLFLGVFFLGYVRRIAFNGADVNPLGPLLLQLAGLLTGLPEDGLVSGVAAALVVLAFGWLLWLLWRSGSDQWVLFLVAAFLAPAAVTAVELLGLHRTEIFFRYFLISVTFFLLMLAALLARGIRRGGVGRVVALLALAVFCIGNGVRIVRFETIGRGQYQQALMYMVEHSSGRVVSISSDHNFRNPMVLAFYRQDLVLTEHLPPSTIIDYKSVTASPGAADSLGVTDSLGVKYPQWFLLTAADRLPRPPAGVVLGDDRLYAFERAFGHYGLSGWGWWLYRDMGRRPPVLP